MIFELFEDMVKMVFIVFCLHVVFRTYVRLRQPAWSMALERRRLATLLVLVLAVLAIKVTEDVLGGESGPIDKAILFFIHDHVSPAWTATFRAITLSGSASVLTPGIAAVTAILLLRRHRHEAFLLAASALLASGLVYVVKTWVGRARPALWPSEWYSGSSFPSGHTLAVAATAAALALAVIRLRPAFGRWAIGAAFAVALGDRSASGLMALGSVLMLAGVVLHLAESHGHEHEHEALEHEHAHRHGDGHHDHHHDPMPAGEHSHGHRHAPLRHQHPHVPDAHHGHRH